MSDAENSSSGAKVWDRAGAAQVFLAFFAATFALYVLRTILVPIVLAVFLAYVLGPLVDILSTRIPRTKVAMPRSLATVIVVMLFMGVLGVVGLLVVNEVVAFAGELPNYEPQISESLMQVRSRIAEWQSHAEALIEPIRPGPVRPMSEMAEDQVQILLDQSKSAWWTGMTGYLFGGLTSILELTGQFLTCIFVLFFALLESPVLKTKVINIMGTTLRRRRVLLEVMQNVNDDVQRYLFNRVATNFVLAMVAWLIYSLFGLKYALLLGVLAGIFNFVPYVGPIIGTIFPILATYMQFGDGWQVFWVMMAYGAMTGIEGNFVTPVVLGKHLKLNSLAVLLACIFWGWLWGPIGLFLAVPIMAAFKALSEHIDTIRPAGELMRG